MANAGCINAYDCNGCLIQTLQNLDSACIGVGVQYTAPNPLDDKRLDYIKYTDKCGCVQCLSAENEILIYATNGVIKNLTLTNDDVNEAIKIKWNDIFGSNRAKTIVRYKTGSYPVSITDGTLAVEETTKNQYSSTPFSLSGVLDETTYYISAFAVDSNGTIIDVQTNSITTSFFLSKYQRVEYIQNSGTQYIITGITTTNNIKTETKIEETTTYQDTTIFGTYNTGSGIISSRYYSLTPYQNKWWRGLNGSEANGGTYTPQVGKQYKIVYNDSNNNLVVDGTTVASVSGTTGPSGNKFVIGCRYGGNTRYGKFRYFYLKLYDKSQSKYVGDFVPCYRKSDNVIGMIDKITKTFYTNNGSGTFSKGSNIPR